MIQDANYNVRGAVRNRTLPIIWKKARYENLRAFPLTPS